MKRLFLLLHLTFIFNCLPVSAGSSAKGTTAASFLEFGASARGVAMGEAFTALTDDSTSIEWNPAGLAHIQSRSFSLMHAPYLDSTHFNHASFGAKLKKHHALGASLRYFSAGEIETTDDSGNDAGELKPNDSSFGVGYALSGKYGSGGIAVKYVRSKIIDTADTFAFDAGLMSTRMFNDKLSFGAVASNMGGKLKYDQKDESLPVLLKLGSAASITKAWIASLDVGFPKSNEAFLAAGTEYFWNVSKDLSLALRGGFNTRTMDETEGVTGVSGGFGVALRKLKLDYGLVPFGDLGLTHQISVSYDY